jgi:excisionase family DNA binding protein
MDQEHERRGQRQLLLADQDAAALLGIARTTLLEEWRAGRIMAVRIGRRRLFHIRDIEAYADRLREEQARSGR